MKLLVWILAAVLALVPVAMVGRWIGGAKDRLSASEHAQATPGTAAQPAVAVAAADDRAYCTPELKQVLRRVLQSCGLSADGTAGGGGRGCQPVQARSVATMSGSDFNALFVPLSQRAGIIEFDRDSDVLGANDTALIDRLFADQTGASYFFVVSRASPEGSAAHNSDLSHRRAEAVMAHLRATFHDPDLEHEVGLLWLGEEFAQLDQQFCSWQRSEAAGQCRTENLNRSAFIAWIDCRL